MSTLPESEWWGDDSHAAAAAAVIARRAQGRTVTPDSNLELDLGLDSMDRLELRTELEQQCGVRIADERCAAGIVHFDIIYPCSRRSSGPTTQW